MFCSTCIKGYAQFPRIMFHIAYVAYKYMVCFCMKVYVVFACVCPMNLCGFVYMYGTNVVLFTCVDDPSEDKL